MNKCPNYFCQRLYQVKNEIEVWTPFNNQECKFY